MRKFLKGKRKPRELTEEERIKKEYSNLYNLNQRLKNISQCYYIGHDGVILMKSLVPFIETIVHPYDLDSIRSFVGAMILPNKFFEFGKNIKKSLLTIDPYYDRIELGQENKPELKYEINIVNRDSGNDDLYQKNQIRPKMYKRFFELENEEFHPFPDKGEFYNLTREEMDILIEPQPLYLDFQGAVLLLTKNLFLDLKKGDQIGICRMCWIEIPEERKDKVYYMIRHDTDIYTSYTIMAMLRKVRENNEDF